MRTSTLVGLLIVVGLAMVPLASAHGNDVVADDQVSVDGTVLAERVHTLTDSWLVLHEDTNGSIGEPLGHVLVEPDGDETDVAVEINQSVWNNWTAPRTVQLVLHNQEGDAEFDPAEDDVLESATGPVASTVRVRPGNETAYVGAETDGRQQTNGTASVRTVILPTDGFLVLRNDGEIVASEYLSAGRHENRRLRIDETAYRRLDREFELTAVVYRDDGDETLDEGDHPIRVGNGTVSTEFGFERTDSRTPVATTTRETASTESTHDDHEHTHESTNVTTTDVTDATPTATAAATPSATTAATPTATIDATPTATADATPTATADATSTATADATATDAADATTTGAVNESPANGDADGTVTGQDDDKSTTTTASGPGFGPVIMVGSLATTFGLLWWRRND